MLWDIPRDSEGNALPEPEKARCPNCNQHAVMVYQEDLESYFCPNCTYTVTESYGQLPLPSESSKLEPQSKGKLRPFIKSFSSNSRELTMEEELTSDRGENKRYVGSANQALEAEYSEFQEKIQENRDDYLREVYNESHLDMTTESSLTRFRADRDRKSRMNESK
jgi:ribosomal protein S27AE